MPTPTLMDYFLVVDALIQDQVEKLSPDYRHHAIYAAVAEHSRIQPVLQRRTLAGTGTSSISLPTGFVADFSAVQRIEYPVGDIPPSYLSSDEWLLTSTVTGTSISHITFMAVQPGVGEHVRVEWSVPHAVTEAGGTIPEGHYRAVATLGASYACLELSAYYAQSGDPLIAVDSQNPLSKSADYRALAKEYRERYRYFFGLGSEDEAAGTDVTPGNAYAYIPTSFQWGMPLLTHRQHKRS